MGEYKNLSSYFQLINLLNYLGVGIKKLIGCWAIKPTSVKELPDKISQLLNEIPAGEVNPFGSIVGKM